MEKEGGMERASAPTAPRGGPRDEGYGVVDMQGPMVPQVWKLGDRYWEWVHKPSKQRSYRLFAGDLYELFSWTPWWVIPIVWVPIILVLTLDALGVAGWQVSPAALLSSITPTAATASAGSLDTTSFAVVFAMGMVMWSFLEYCLHRFLFHILVLPGTSFAIQFHFILHGQHHKFPTDRGCLVFPPVAGFMMATPFYLFFHMTMTREVANALTAGALLGYIGYDLTHYYLHHGRPVNPYFRRLKLHHMQHHYGDSSHGFGISSKLWDYPFRTLFSNSRRNTTAAQRGQPAVTAHR